MKKSLIALAVAGALTAPMIAQADATLYGVAQYRGIAQDDMSFKNNMAKTRLGVKGTVDNDVEGLTTGFQFEWEFEGDNQGGSAVSFRKSNVYLKGGFGSVIFGSQNNPANAPEGAYAVLGKYGDAYGLISDRITNGAAYVSPKFSGAEVYFGFVADGVADAVDDTNADVTVYGLNWSGMGVSAKVSAQSESSASATTDEDSLSFGVSYSGVENLYVGASFTTVEADDKTVTDEETLGLGATYKIGKVKLMANYEAYSDNTLVSADQDQSKIGLGVSYALGAKAALAVEYFDFDSDAERVGSKHDALVLQYTLSF